MGVLKTVLWILLVYFALKIIGRLLRPWLLAYARRKTGDFFEQAAARGQQTRQAPTPEGEVSIDKTPTRRANPGKKVGEYIEYEEID
ncbi:DUF4834 family protein [Robiginitalea sp.]|uniref:DUF4834 family protein n=1 Tax=Robiginitalea sp. TaxID=1902411 RepID=UPI003C77366D